MEILTEVEKLQMKKILFYSQFLKVKKRKKEKKVIVKKKRKIIMKIKLAVNQTATSIKKL